MIKVLVNGAKGRMGTHVVATVESETDLELVAATDLGDDLSACIASSGAEVVVDFTQPDCAYSNSEEILKAGACPVIGTTGFAASDVERLRVLSRELGVGGVIAPNFSIGALLVMKFAAEAARYFPDVEIIELHHDQKADAPSGTAIKTAEWIAESRGEHRSGPEKEQETIPGARGGRLKGIPIHSVRLPGYVAHEEIVFGGQAQILSLRHDSMSRECFMPGVALVARKVRELDHVVYGLENLLEL